MMLDGQPLLFVSLHDVTPYYSNEIRAMMELLDELNVTGTSLLTIPHYRGVSLNQDPKFSGWLRARSEKGDEVVLHGWQHVEHRKPKGLARHLRRMLFTRGEGEFLGLSEDECGELLDNGLKLLAAMDFSPRGFVAPAWLIEKSLYPVLRERGFIYTTRQSGIVDLADGRLMLSPALVLRGSSNTMSKLSRFVNNIRIGFNGRRDIIRVAIHPIDVRYRALPWYRTILTKLLAERRSITYGRFFSELARSA